MINSKKFFTIADIAEILNVSYDRALHLVKYEGIPHFMIGRQYRVEQKDLEDYITKKKIKKR